MPDANFSGVGILGSIVAGDDKPGVDRAKKLASNDASFDAIVKDLETRDVSSQDAWQRATVAVVEIDYGLSRSVADAWVESEVKQRSGGDPDQLEDAYRSVIRDVREDTEAPEVPDRDDVDTGQYPDPVALAAAPLPTYDEFEHSPDWRTDLETIEEFIAGYAPVEERPEKPGDDEDDPAAAAEWPSAEELNAVADAIPQLTDKQYAGVADAIAERLNRTISRERLDRHCALTRAVTREESDVSVTNYDGALVEVNTNPRWTTCKKLLNFEMEVNARVAVEDEDLMADLTVTPNELTETAFDLQIEPKVFNDTRRFKDEVLAQRFSTTIETNQDESAVMDTLRKYISRQDVPDLVGQKQIGLSRAGDEFVTPNGTIGPNGWIDSPGAIHIAGDIGAERKFRASPDRHDDPDDDEIAEIIELFTRTREPERFLPVLGWMYAAPFRPKIVERSGSFNLLFVTGESGVGKTGTLAIASRMMGMSEEPFSASDTTFARIRTLSASRGTPIWIDEYKTSDLSEWEINELHSHLRKAATGGTEQRGA